MKTELELKKEALATALINQGSSSKTQQAHGAQCNINNIMAEFHQTGIMPHLNKNLGISQINPSEDLDYHQALSLTRKIKQSHHDMSFQPDITPKTEYIVKKGDMPFNP